MADPTSKVPENIPGKYYVDMTCAMCSICRVDAPNNFARSEEAHHTYVFKQPENAEEEAQCEKALDACPISSIGDDG